MKVKSKISQADCTLGTSYGFAQNNAWVDKGCGADFVICFNQGELLICFLPDTCWRSIAAYRGWQDTSKNTNNFWGNVQGILNTFLFAL